MDTEVMYDGHTAEDHAELLRKGVDPSTRQPREHTVRCAVCRRSTMNLAGRCDAHAERYTGGF